MPADYNVEFDGCYVSFVHVISVLALHDVSFHYSTHGKHFGRLLVDFFGFAYIVTHTGVFSLTPFPVGLGQFAADNLPRDNLPRTICRGTICHKPKHIFRDHGRE